MQGRMQLRVPTICHTAGRGGLLRKVFISERWRSWSGASPGPVDRCELRGRQRLAHQRRLVRVEGSRDRGGGSWIASSARRTIGVVAAQLACDAEQQQSMPEKVHRAVPDPSTPEEIEFLKQPGSRF